MAITFQQLDTSVRFHVHVQPRASRTGIVGEHDGALRIRLAAPPVDGEANDELVRFLAGSLRVPRSHVHIVTGQTSRRKTVQVDHATVHDVRAALLAD